MNKHISLLLLLLVSFQAAAQVTNPFDIPGQTKDSITITNDGIDNARLDKEATDVLSTGNPFDIHQNDREMVAENVQPLSNQKKSMSKERTNIIVLVYVLSMLVILTLAISMNRKRFKSMIKATINSNQLRTLYRDTKVWTNGQSVLLYIFFFLNISFAIWIWSVHSSNVPEGNLFYIGLFILSVYLVRHICMWLLANIYPVGPEVDMHNYSIALHNKILGIAVLPIILAIEFLPSEFQPTMTICFLAIIGIIYMLRQGKSLLLGLGMRGLNPFYFFIYLCAVEIAPILVIYKKLMGAL